MSSTTTEDPLLLRVRVDGPYGSAARVQWEDFATVLIVVGGSGVAFGLSVLDKMCKVLRDENQKFVSGRLGDPEQGGAAVHGEGQGTSFLNRLKSQPNVNTTRVRFVWLVREYCKSLTLNRETLA